MAEQLDRTGGPVAAGGLTVRAPGLRGTVDAGRPGSGQLRAAAMVTPLDSQLAQHGLQPTHAAVIDAVVEDPAALRARDGTRAAGTVADPGYVEIQVPDPGPGWEQVVLVHDQVTGALSWSFGARPQLPAADQRGRTTTHRTYALRVAGTADSDAGADRRGLVGVIVKKVVKVLAFKAGEHVVGAAASYFAAKWEAANRPYGLHRIDGTEISTTARQPVTDADWAALRDQRALLLVHGTFSTTVSAFGGLSASTLGELQHRYQNRVLAFDHFTLSQSPVDNVRWLLAQIPPEVSLQLDIVCHSRGGLVSRVLAEDVDGAGLDLARVDVRRAVLVAVPNAGTALADTQRMGALIDTYTNIFTYLPDNPVTNGISGVLEVVKDLAAMIVDGLTGLQAMRPGCDFLTKLNRSLPPSDMRYFAIAADYEPADRGLAHWAVDRIADTAFREGHNDLVVPTDGAYAANGSSRFPIADAHVFKTGDSISHFTYFSHDEVGSDLLHWLTPVGA